MMRCCTIFFLFSVLLLSAQPSSAQWASDSITNTRVCNATGIQQNPSVCSDGADGAIIVWEDNRGSSGWDVYAQRLDASGRAKWTNNGVLLCSNQYDQRYPLVASDNNGGAYVVWQDSRSSTTGVDLYAQHINSDGTLSYSTSGLGIAVVTQIQNNEKICSDEAGNAFVVWEDSRNSVTSSRPDIYMNKLTLSGASFGTTGMAVTTQTSAQRRPAICADGAGGVYVAWETGATVPNSILAQRFNGSGTALWTTPNGISVFQGDNPAKNAKNVSLRRDGNQVMFAWEVTSTNTSSGQDIMANRLRSDSTKVWYSPSEVTGDWFGDQQYPQAFSDDSAGASPNTDQGLLVLFLDNSGTTDRDVAMVRIFPDGVTRLPAYSNGFYYVVKQAYGQVGFQAVTSDPGNLLVAWNDARRNGGADTLVYAQRVDRTLKRYFPTPGLFTTWGKPISVPVGASAKQVAMASRTNGAIVAWTDTRSGNADIYAQVFFKDGSLPIELSQFRVTSSHHGEAELQWKTAQELGNAGFEIQRRAIGDAFDNNYAIVASYTTNAALRGAGTSNMEHSYAYTDRSIAPAIYEYRLIDIALDGSRTAHDPKQVDARFDQTVANFSMGPNQPNPAIATTVLPISLPTDAIIDLAIFDVTGRMVVAPVSHRLLSSGSHELNLDLRSMNLPNGNYLIRATATDPGTGAQLWHSDKPVMMQIVR